ncbi:MAG: lytic transglycosylase domain-containing protein, partial [Leptospiraceae bacterium]|nr:lytic transglycosylase domain-containing protein [Leptospiraceae bacterium]
PGSFYAGALWETNPEKRDFVSDWRQVNDRASYLLWVARHGGNVEAIRHLKGRNLQPYMDPEALQLWKDMNTGGVPVDENIVLLFRLGERGLGDEFFDNRYEGHITVRENLARMSEIGRRSGSLDLSVYFTRQLAREMLIPEDPFSMPEGLLKVLYPRPYYQLVSSNARRYNIESDMVYALMRQESLFREKAISRSGARGLMQIMPTTGNWLAEKMGLPRPDLMDPEINIQLGAKYFSDLINQTGNFRWASIAYNGGPGNLRRWKASYYRNDDFYFFLENIPRSEPRNYCRITYQNYMHYRTTYILYP